ncbi:MAG: hypothetical protein HOP07_17795 [Bacteriovoracaceae bacterium]|nr:hypothetical protein [Bacteriovoracaceae bacterium]
MKKIILTLSLLISVNVIANESCQDLTKCVEIVSKLTGKKYIFSGKLEGELKSSSNFVITSENADTMFSYILNASGYSRVPTVEKDTYKIVPARDIRYESVSALKADLNTTPVIPSTEDYVFLTYKFANYKDGQPRELSNTLRPFMSRYGRIIELIDSVTIQEMGTKLPQQLEFMRKVDRPLSKEEIAIKKQRSLDHDKRMEREAKQEKIEKKEDKKI